MAAFDSIKLLCLKKILTLHSVEVQFLGTRLFTEHLRWLLLNKPRRSLWFIVWRNDALVI